MRSLIFVLLITLLISGCEGRADLGLVVLEHVTEEELVEITVNNDGYTYSEQGDYTIYSRIGDICHIYMKYPELYESDNAYTYWAGHALRHCYKKDWHEIPFDIPARGTISDICLQ